MTHDGMDIHMVAPLDVEGRVSYLTCVISMAVAWVGILPDKHLQTTINLSEKGLCLSHISSKYD
jgi:hypothetical protein